VLARSSAKGRSVATSALPLAFIHRSAWNRNSPKFGCMIVHRPCPGGVGCSGDALREDRGEEEHEDVSGGCGRDTRPIGPPGFGVPVACQR
jgi:hypothetical protein